MNNMRFFFSQEFNIFLFNPQEVKIFSPDYTNIDKEKAIEDFKTRIKHYEAVYEALNENSEDEG